MIGELYENKEGFLLRKLGNEYVAVAMGKARKSFNGLIRMNDTGKILWDCLKEDRTEEELVKYLTAEYEVSEAEAGADVHAFAEKLKKAGILV